MDNLSMVPALRGPQGSQGPNHCLLTLADFILREPPEHSTLTVTMHDQGERWAPLASGAICKPGRARHGVVDEDTILPSTSRLQDHLKN